MTGPVDPESGEDTPTLLPEVAAGDVAEDRVVLTAAQVAADTDGIMPHEPAPLDVVDRPDGRAGYAEQLAGAELLPGGPAVAGARHRLAKAREQGAHPDEVVRLQRELADVAGYKLREHDQPLPTDGEGPVIHELVVTDVMNRLAVGIKRYGQPLRAGNGRSFLQDAYEEVLDLAAYLRGAIEEERIRAAAAGEDEVPAPPRTGRVRVAVVDGVSWLWNGDEQQWVVLTPGTVLSDEQRAAVEEHTGPLG